MQTPIDQPLCGLCHLRMGSAEKTVTVDNKPAHMLCAKLHEFKKDYAKKAQRSKELVH